MSSVFQPIYILTTCPDSKITKLSKELSEVTKERDEIKETLTTLRKALHQ